MSALAGLRARVAEAAAAAGLAGIDVVTRPSDSGAAHVEPRGDRFDLVRCERGQELERQPLLGCEDCAYLIVFDAALARALAEEGAARQGYSRWNWMAAHIALMGRADVAWALRARAHYRAVLERAPLSADEIAAIRPGLPWPDERGVDRGRDRSYLNDRS